MTIKEQKLIFSQFIKLIIDSRNLINFLNRDFTSEYKDNIQNLVNSISNTIDKYYMNFDICDCGHPIPTLPNKLEEDNLEDILDNYIDLYELKTGNDLDNLFVKDSNKKIVKEPLPVQLQQVINLPDSIKDKAKRADKTKHIKGTLIKVGK
jgi:vacuolar-type H+-ATPase subunit C/Vma6